MSKIFVGGITPNTSDEMMIEAFSIYGAVTEAIVMRERDTYKSRGFGFVTYADFSSAQNCVSQGAVVDGRNVDCKLAQSKEDMENRARVQPFNGGVQGGYNGVHHGGHVEPPKPALGEITSGKIFIGGLSQATNQDSLLAAMQVYGEVTEVMVMFDKVTEKSRGFGFVTFSDPNSVNTCMQIQGLEVDGKVVEIKPAQEKSATGPGGAPMTKPQPASLKLFVGGLASVTSEASLEQYFGQFGPLSQVTVMMDRDTGRSRGFGFVEFTGFDSVAAVLANNNHQVDGKWVECKSAVPETSNGGKPTGKGAPGGGKGFQQNGKGFGGKGGQQFGGKGFGGKAGGFQGGYQQRAHPY